MTKKTNMPVNSSGREYIWVLANTYTRWLWPGMLEHLCEISGLPGLLIVNTDQDRTYYEKKFSGSQSVEIVVRRNPYNDVVDGANADGMDKGVVDAACAIEDRFDIKINRAFTLADRHLGRGYLTLGHGHPESSISENASYGTALSAAVTQFEYTEDLFNTYPPRVVVSYYSGGGLAGKPFALLCREKSIPFKTLCPARFGDLMFWADDEFEGNSELARYLSQPAPVLSDDEIADITAGLKPTGLSTNPAAMSEVKKSRDFTYALKMTMSVVARHYYGLLRGYSFSKVGYKWWSKVAFYWRAREHWKQVDTYSVSELPKRPGQKLVYFPLQQEPEASTLVLSPEHADQAATIIELSLQLPANAILVVKEHIWQIGRRPNGFYRRLRQVPNVVLMHPLCNSLEIIRSSDLICTISSSAGFEAAALGKRALFFWDKAPISMLPNVTILSKFQGEKTIAELLADIDPSEAKAYQNAGAVFLKRLTEFSMDLAPLKIHKRQQAPTNEELEFLSEDLIQHVLASSNIPETPDGVDLKTGGNSL